jgi:ribose 5-phosphate isomerase RpiB
MIREHNNSKMNCLGQKVLESELAGLLLQISVESAFTGVRHAKRVDKLDRQAKAATPAHMY